MKHCHIRQMFFEKRMRNFTVFRNYLKDNPSPSNDSKLHSDCSSLAKSKLNIEIENVANHHIQEFTMPYVPKRKAVKARRVPVQARAIERVNKILDTAAEIMADPDSKKVTTHLIADRANVSVGSVYQFFPNVESVKIALIERLLDQYYERFDATITANPGISDLGEFSKMLVTATNDFYASHPEIVELIVSSHASEEFREVNSWLNQRVLKRVVEYFSDIDTGLSQAELMRRVSVVIAISDVMTMFIWSAEDKRGREAFLQDWHDIIWAYSSK